MNNNHRLLFGTHSMRLTLIRLIVVASVACQVAKGQEAQSTNTESVSGQTDAGGLRLIIQPEKPPFRLDESVRIDIVVTNLTEGGLRISEHSVVTDFELIVKNDNGQNVPLTEYGHMDLVRVSDIHQ